MQHFEFVCEDCDKIYTPEEIAQLPEGDEGFKLCSNCGVDEDGNVFTWSTFRVKV